MKITVRKNFATFALGNLRKPSLCSNFKRALKRSRRLKFVSAGFRVLHLLLAMLLFAACAGSHRDYEVPMGDIVYRDVLPNDEPANSGSVPDMSAPAGWDFFGEAGEVDEWDMDGYESEVLESEPMPVSDDEPVAAPAAAPNATPAATSAAPERDRVPEEDPFRGESYVSFVENAFVNTRAETAVTFTMQMDTASYGNVSRYINSGFAPPVDAVRVAEMINYFNWDGDLTTNDSPFSIYTEIGPSPFNDGMYLAFVRVRAQDIDRTDLPGNNLTFLIDTSGSMAPSDRLPLLKRSLELLVENMDARDTISIVTYASGSQVLLDSVSGSNQAEIMRAINNLSAGGSTAGAQGITTAYALAQRNFNPEMNNRIILCTDGDFNVGVSSVRELTDLMAEQRRNGIHMTILGYGMGNYRDTTMETIARNGNGAYHYINTIADARKIFIEELTSNLYIVAEEVRAQVVFNADTVANYRLIGYENRIMENRHFDDDSRDAGEVGVGADLVIMFEIQLSQNTESKDLFTVRVRYKNPGEPASKLIEIPAGRERMLSANTTDFNFAAAVASFGHILRNSEYNANATLSDVLSLARDATGPDIHGHRRSFIEMVEAFQRIR
ncbi:MAG: VWA domain-containing protein [Clostridiales bacterium]|nr:VWA domain-containing protein [Clostridiales bacterium]